MISCAVIACTVKWESSAIMAMMVLMLTSLTTVLDALRDCNSTDSWAALKSLCRRSMVDPPNTSTPNTSCDNTVVSAMVFFNLIQNLITDRCSTEMPVFLAEQQHAVSCSRHSLARSSLKFFFCVRSKAHIPSSSSNAYMVVISLSSFLMPVFVTLRHQ